MSGRRRAVNSAAGKANATRIVRVEPVRTPVLRVTFDDGVTREVDLSETVARSR